jgi:hypothetical protein
MDFRDLGRTSAKSGLFIVTIALTVDDAQTLWDAAADLARAAPGMTTADVLDTIGPREDPALINCISMLTAPRGIGGCALETYEVRSAAVGQMIHQLPIQTRGLPLIPAANS